jgi:hypothetical protein
VSDIFTADEPPFLRLREIKNCPRWYGARTGDRFMEDIFHHARFRPVQKRKTSIKSRARVIRS